jgi:DNA-binding response OmpR family regulator
MTASLAPRAPRIVIVEDDPSLLGALAFALEAEGYRVGVHLEAATALGDREPVDCLVIDLQLPDLDGLSLIAELRQNGVWAPAILITTDPDDRCRKAAAAAKVEIVEKPLLSEDLRQ